MLQHADLGGFAAEKKAEASGGKSRPVFRAFCRLKYLN